MNAPPASPPSTGPAGRLAITMGDPAGIGPEIIAKLWARGRADNTFVVGIPEVLERARQWVLASGEEAARTVRVQEIGRPADMEGHRMGEGVLPVLRVPCQHADVLAVPVGQVDRRAGVVAAACIRMGVRLAQHGDVAGIVTAPIHKEALALAGEPYPGHTELLQVEGAPPGCPVPPVRMMLANDQLKTVLVTIHMALRQAIEQVTYEAVLETIRITHASAGRWGQRRPRIAVAGLNPHAGEGGLFGREDIDIIAPAVRAACAEGIDASGPWAPDTIFMRARHAPDHAGEFDIVVAMYHDQGLIPVKYLGLDEGVNVTLGLPFVRTSPDHGTAFDLAGTGRADESSLRAAWRMARRLVGGGTAQAADLPAASAAS